jgi:dTMP kinase
MHYRASHLLFSLNRWEKREEILNSLDKGTNVIIDRYAFSGIVYSIVNVK